MSEDSPHDGRSAWSVWITNVAAGGAIIASLLVLGPGWLGNLDSMIRPVENSAVTVPLTALCVLAQAIALLLLGAFPRAAQTLSLIVIGIAVVNFGLILGGTPEGLTSYLPHEHVDGDRMAPGTSLGLIGAGIGTLMIVRHWVFLPMAFMTLGVSACVFVILLDIGNLSSAPLFEGLRGMSLYTKLMLLSLYIGIASRI